MRRASAFVFLCSLPALGQVPLSLRDAEVRALEKNHGVAIERESFRISRDAIALAEGSAYDPTFRLDARYRTHTDPVNSVFSGAPADELAPTQKGVESSAQIAKLFPTGTRVSVSTAIARQTTDGIFTTLSPAYTTQFGIDVRQPLLRGFRTDDARRAVRVAGIDNQRSAASLRRVVTDTVSDVEKLYWTYASALRNVDVRQSSMALADEQRRDTEAKIEAGTLPESDLSQSTAELERRRGELYAARENARRAELALKTLMLADPADPLWNQEIAPSDEPAAAPFEPDLAAALETAKEKRPELSAARLTIERQDVDIALADDELKPALDVVGSYQGRGLAGSKNPGATSFNPGQPVVVAEPLDGGVGRSFGTLFENRFPDASIGLSLSIPLGNRAARAKGAIARATKRQAELGYAREEQRIATEVRVAVLALQTARQRIEAANAGPAAAETQFGAEKEPFTAGPPTNFFVLTRQNDLAVAQLTRIDALADYQRARVELARATGSLLDDRKIEVGEKN